VEVLKRSEVSIDLNLSLGTASATAWGCDLSEEYVTINSQYTT
jgi:glutamate N-acetyltransferase/amino-acid N-acetyltransferase